MSKDVHLDDLPEFDEPEFDLDPEDDDEWDAPRASAITGNSEDYSYLDAVEDDEADPLHDQEADRG